MRGMFGKLGVALGATALLVAAIALTGANDGSCLPEPEGCETHDECGEGMYCDEGACETLGYCETAQDCYGQPIIHPMCVGYFTCQASACVYRCGSPAPGQGEDCPDDVCAAGLTCVHYYGIAGPSGPLFKSCEIPCDRTAECPEGQQCVTIADGPGQVCYAY